MARKPGKKSERRMHESHRAGHCSWAERRGLIYGDYEWLALTQPERRKDVLRSQRPGECKRRSINEETYNDRMTLYIIRGAGRKRGR